MKCLELDAMTEWGKKYAKALIDSECHYLECNGYYGKEISNLCGIFCNCTFAITDVSGDCYARDLTTESKIAIPLDKIKLCPFIAMREGIELYFEELYFEVSNSIELYSSRCKIIQNLGGGSFLVDFLDKNRQAKVDNMDYIKINPNLGDEFEGVKIVEFDI
jgi:hypothetical protein